MTPEARKIVSSDVELATYEFGDPDAPTVVAVHGFASSTLANYGLGLPGFSAYAARLFDRAPAR